ncbi:hypothetical protein ABZY16_05745 [Streptomyces sp. NPDC006553]|uniref:hypothetical protein n=1 Tax=unclassified Streptomyces TaxID=2593676 RepID=UPI0022551A5A|nr:hypothetical protein [Streptomyces sp. NBC_00233]MCX5228933.1 hypothetical protein [Streptomyces sp. NBC_00233]
MTADMLLTLSPDARQTREFTCDCRDAPKERAWDFIYADGAPYAVHFADCCHHTDRDHDACRLWWAPASHIRTARCSGASSIGSRHFSTRC